MVKIIQKEINNPDVKILKYKKSLIASGAVILIALGLFFAKGLFIAATVNGSLISRLSVIRELEKSSGKQALESLIQKKLIETELDKRSITITEEEIDGEIKKIEDQMASQNRTLKDVLLGQGMTEGQLREQITLQKKLEKLLADKIQVSDEELSTYIKDNKVATPEDVDPEDFRMQLSSKLKQNKFQQEAAKWVSELVASAKIKYYVNY